MKASLAPNEASGTKEHGDVMTSVSSSSTPPQLWDRASRSQKLQGGLMLTLFGACALATVLTTVGIIFVLGVEAIGFFSKSGIGPIEFLTGSQQDWTASPPKFGILPLIWGTFMIAVGSAIIALPIGLFSAIFLSEYASARLRSWLKPILELLAGIPSIVYGYLALLLVTPLLQATLNPLFDWLGVPWRVEFFNAISACVVVGIMIIPMVSSLSEDALSAVPKALREAAYGLGATKYEVSFRVVLPAALSGVISSFILAISRAVGETMAVVLAAGTVPNLTLNPLVSVETMTAYIVAVTTGEAASGSPEHLSLFAVGLALFGVTMVFNLISLAILRRYREVYQ